MRKKTVFFDADGTVCDIEKGTPDSAVQAIARLRENGHDAWLCTGRSRAFVPDYLEKVPFTGMISACGATIEKDGQRIFDRQVTPQVAWKSVQILRKYHMIPVMEGPDHMYYDKEEYNNNINWYADIITRTIGDKWRPIRGNENAMFINKISAKVNAESNVSAALSELENDYDFIHHEQGEGLAGDTIEMVPKGFNKAVGIAAVCRIYDIAWEDTVVFGDSNNDLAMFEYAATKVAMGNASPKILGLADYITADLFHYGIQKGLEHLGLI